MRFLKRFWNKYTLFCILILTSLPLTLLGLAGRNTIYGGFEYTPAEEPLLALVLEGIHEDVYPWELIIKDKAEEGKEDEEASPPKDEEKAQEGVSAKEETPADTAAKEENPADTAAKEEKAKEAGADAKDKTGDAKAEEKTEGLPRIIATDISPEAVDNAHINAIAAGVAPYIEFSACDFGDTPIPPCEDSGKGCVFFNPEYGIRLGDPEELAPVYKRIGTFLNEKCSGWTGALITGNPDLYRSFWSVVLDCIITQIVCHAFKEFWNTQHHY